MKIRELTTLAVLILAPLLGAPLLGTTACIGGAEDPAEEVSTAPETCVDQCDGTGCRQECSTGRPAGSSPQSAPTSPPEPAPILPACDQGTVGQESTWSCNDGIDNDCDGLVDCYDFSTDAPDCLCGAPWWW